MGKILYEKNGKNHFIATALFAEYISAVMKDKHGFRY